MRKLLILLFLVPALAQAQNPNYSKPSKRTQQTEPAPECFTNNEIQIGAHIAAFEAWSAKEGLRVEGGNTPKDYGYEKHLKYFDKNDFKRKDGTLGSITFYKSYYFIQDTCIAMGFVPHMGANKDLALKEMETRLGSEYVKYDSTFTDHDKDVYFTRYTWLAPELNTKALFEFWNRETVRGTRYDEYTIVFLRQEDTPKQAPYIVKAGI